MPEDTVYIFDTCAFDHIDDHNASNAIWSRVIELFESGKIRLPKEAFVELERVNPQAYARIKDYRRSATIRRSEVFFLRAGAIAGRYRRMSGTRKRNDKADPWIVAAALIFDNHVVVTDEKYGKRQSIPKVCEREGADCLSLNDFIGAEGLDILE